MKQHASLGVVDLPATGGPGRSGPAWPDGGRRVARTLISPNEWILTVPPPGSQDAGVTRGLAGILAGQVPFRLPPPQPMAVVRARAAPGTREIGPTLHYRNGTGVLYCAAGRLESLGAAALAAVAGDSGIFSRGHAGDAVRTVAVELVSHDSPVHPAAAAVSARKCVFLICARLIDTGLAEMIGQVWTAHAGLLASLGRVAVPGQAR